MAVFLLNICKFNKCNMQFETLLDLIQHIEENHIGEYHEILAFVDTFDNNSRPVRPPPLEYLTIILINEICEFFDDFLILSCLSSHFRL